MNGLSDGDDVLVTHRQTNRAQKAPNPRHLHTHRTTMTGKKQLFLSDDESEDNISDSPPPPPAKQPRKTRTRGVEIKPSSLGYYDDQWRAILREAQNEWRCESVLKLPDPFPSATCDLGSAKNVLENVVARHLNAGAVLRHSRCIVICAMFYTNVFNKQAMRSPATCSYAYVLLQALKSDFDSSFQGL